MKSLTLCLLGALLAGCAGDPKPGYLVFQSSRNGSFDLFVMKDDGSGLQQITRGPAYDVSPSWSPDGSSIAFASNGEGNWDIYRIGRDGSDLRRLTRDAGSNTSPSWTPDGEAILFVSTRAFVGGEIYRMRADGGHPERLTADSTVKDSPVMTPDGRRVIFTSSDHEWTRIAVLDLSTRAVRYLTPKGEHARQPDLSRDGAEVIYERAAGDRSGIARLGLADGESQPVDVVSGEAFWPAYGRTAHDVIFTRRGALMRLNRTNGTEVQLSSSGDYRARWREVD